MSYLHSDAIATPLSLYEPVYQDGGDTLYLMDQVKDKKNKEDSWVGIHCLKRSNGTSSSI